MNKYNVKVNYNNVTPLMQELEEINELINITKFGLFTETDVLQFASGSKTANYDFLIDDIDHDAKIVWLLAV